nr:hypothetical protein [Tanacetum cinerariifolium]
MRYDSTTRIYSCQLDEQCFNIHKDILRDALQITPINDNDPFVALPSSDVVIGYPCNLKFVRKDGREVFGMPTPDAILTGAIIRAPHYGGYMAHVAEYQRYLDGEHSIEDEEAVPEYPKATKNAMLAIPSPTIGKYDKAHDPKAEIDAWGQSND